MVRPVKHVYQNIIVHHMMKQCIHFTCDNKNGQTSGVYISAIGRRISCSYLPQSVSGLYRAIENPDILRPGGNPEITPKTVRRRLKDMVKEHVLVKLPKSTGRRWRRNRYRQTKTPYNNETFYVLHANQLYFYLDYLLTVLTRGSLSKAERDKILLEELGLRYTLLMHSEKEILEMTRKRLSKRTYCFLPRIYLEDIRVIKKA